MPSLTLHSLAIWTSDYWLIKRPSSSLLPPGDWNNKLIVWTELKGGKNVKFNMEIIISDDGKVAFRASITFGGTSSSSRSTIR